MEANVSWRKWGLELNRKMKLERGVLPKEDGDLA